MANFVLEKRTPVEPRTPYRLIQLPQEKDSLARLRAACWEKGYAATSIADIRNRSGASTGSIYHFFDGKGALAEVLLARAVSGWAAASACR